MAPPFFFAQSKSSTEDQLNEETTPTKKDPNPNTSSTTSARTAFASMMPQLVTPSTVGSTKSKRKTVVKSHTRNLKSRKPLDYKSLIKVGTLVARTFKTWPCSRVPGDPPVPVRYRGMVTEIDQKSKKIHALFENAQTMRFDLDEIIPLVVGKKRPKAKEASKAPHDSKKKEVHFDLKTVADACDKVYDMDTETVSNHSDEVEYIGTKSVPDVELVKVITSPKKGSMVIDFSKENKEEQDKFATM